MTWNASLPSNSTKIRNYPTVLTNNFSAVEQGDISLKHWQSNFIERNGVAPSNDPTRADDTMILYSKQDASGNTELFVLDDRNPANVIQLTKGGKIGSESTQAVFQNISFASETSTYTSTNLTAYWAIVSSAGAIVASSGGLTASRTSTGVFAIGFTTPQSSVNYGVTLGIEADPPNPALISYRNKTVNGFGVRMVNQNGTNIDRAFTIAVYGGRS
jgi:hypothetical protein